MSDKVNQINFPESPTSTSEYGITSVDTSSEAEYYCKVTYEDEAVVDSSVAQLLVYGRSSYTGEVSVNCRHNNGFSLILVIEL